MDMEGKRMLPRPRIIEVEPHRSHYASDEAFERDMKGYKERRQQMLEEMKWEGAFMSALALCTVAMVIWMIVSIFDIWGIAAICAVIGVFLAITYAIKRTM